MAQVPDGFHRINFNCPEETYALLLQHCKRSQRTMASVLNSWILEGLGQHIPEDALRLSPDFLRGEQLQLAAVEVEGDAHIPLPEVEDDVPSRLL